MKASIAIKIKEIGKPIEWVDINVDYDERLADLKMRELGDMLLRCNSNAVIEVWYNCYSVDNGWKRVKTYFPYLKIMVFND